MTGRDPFQDAFPKKFIQPQLINVEERLEARFIEISRRAAADGRPRKRRLFQSLTRLRSLSSQGGQIISREVRRRVGVGVAGVKRLSLKRLHRQSPAKRIRRKAQSKPPDG